MFEATGSLQNHPLLIQQWVLFGLATVAVLISLVTDLRSRLIYNWVTLPSLLLGLVLHLAFWGWSGQMGLGLKWSLIGMLAGGLPFLVLNSVQRSAFGGGDVKLIAALGALLGAPLILQVLLRIAVSGGLLAIVVLIWQGQVLATFIRVFRRRSASVNEGEAAGDGVPADPSQDFQESDLDAYSEKDSMYIPYGVAIAAGTVWTLVAAFS